MKTIGSYLEPFQYDPQVGQTDGIVTAIVASYPVCFKENLKWKLRSEDVHKLQTRKFSKAEKPAR